MRRDDTHLTDEDLLFLIDGELSARRRSRAEAHLSRCEACREKRDRIDYVTAMVSETYGRNTEPAAIGEVRHALRAALNASTTSLTRSWRFAFASMLAAQAAAVAARTATPAWALAAVVTATSLLAFDLHTRSAAEPTRIAASVEPGALPDCRVHPWSHASTRGRRACVSTQPQSSPRRLPVALRDQVLRQYRMERVSPADYELDYLITPELGGAPEAANLWPERYGLPNWNARVKDQLEDLLPRLVCSRAVPLAVAQQAIAGDWIAAYKKYFNTSVPLSGQAHLRDDDDALVFEVADAPALRLFALSATAEFRCRGTRPGHGLLCGLSAWLGFAGGGNGAREGVFPFSTPAWGRCVAVCRRPLNSGILFSPRLLWPRGRRRFHQFPARVTRSTCMTRRSLLIGGLATAMYVGALYGQTARPQPAPATPQPRQAQPAHQPAADSTPTGRVSRCAARGLRRGSACVSQPVPASDVTARR